MLTVMTTMEKVELGLILLFVLGTYIFAFSLPEQVQLGLGVVWIAGIAFVQSLLRDLTIMARKNLHPAEAVEKQCFCLESLVGVSVLLVGFLLFFSGNSTTLILNGSVWSTVVFATLMIGFLIKDLVLTWKPLGIHREKDHMNIIVKW